ncbi:hypothetical protein KIN20_012090 [Parelaphostrongylus tenuis]|uniref:Uncharacterized protein n=1 Tax=Parelaphostrongylus tenuis TaxID=148309 RepID=A0AAD5MDX2_PARTN|nr:hypothetical protein KIN20_012090 [Parelaphostrongylus tenuis]
MESNMKEEPVRRRRAAWAAFRPLREATDQLTDPQLRANQRMTFVLRNLMIIVAIREMTHLFAYPVSCMLGASLLCSTVAALTMAILKGAE